MSFEKSTYCCFVLIFSLLFSVFVISCSMQGSQKSFASSLNEIDILIKQNQYDDAVRQLGKIEKNAYSAWSHLGIFRRYNQMGLKEKALAVLKKAIKSNPENLELKAVYVNFLINSGDTKNAIAEGKILQGTKYGSLYSEAILKDAFSNTEKDDLYKKFSDEIYLPIYKDAYSASKNTAWLKNCALIFLAKGKYENAISFFPDTISTAFDAYFWALAMFDDKRYADAQNCCEIARELLEKVVSNGVKVANDKGLGGNFAIENVYSLEADAWTELGDNESAEKIRQIAIKNGNALAETYVNSARWALDNENFEECAKYAFFAVENWKDFVPALSLYANFALESNKVRNEDTIQLQLRDAGTATLEMEKFDNRAKIPISDAVTRINDSLERTKDPYLFVLSTDLRYKLSKNLTEKDKIADLWNILEKNAISPNIYPDVLFDYALNFLLSNNYEADAWNLFAKFISTKYSIPLDENFWNELYERKSELLQKEKEYAAFFVANQKRADDAVRFYENLCFEEKANSTDFVLSPHASDSSSLNLATIYDSLAQKKSALALYTKVSGRTSNIKLKSEIMTKIAKVYYKSSDYKNAKKSAQYAVSLNNRNAEAKLLLDKLR